MIHGVIFDADGTLIDSMKMWDDVGVRYLARLGVTADADLPELMFTMTLEESSAHIKRHYGLAETEAEIRDGLTSVIADFFHHEVTLKPGVRETLANLHAHRVPMTIATSGDKELLTAALTRLGVINYFTEILTCTEYNTTKHERYIYDLAASRMGTDAAHTAVFEDVIFGITTAKGAGYFVVAVEDTESAKDRDKIRAIADLYTKDYTNLSLFWAQVSAQ